MIFSIPNYNSAMIGYDFLKKEFRMNVKKPFLFLILLFSGTLNVFSYVHAMNHHFDDDRRTEETVVNRDLVDAVEDNDYEKVRILLEQGVDPNDRDSSGVPIWFHAASSNHQYIVGIFISRGANPSATDLEGYNAFSYTTDEVIIKYLKKMQSRQSRKTFERTGAIDLMALINAISIQDFDLAIRYINSENVLDFNIQDNNGYTALIYAVYFQNIELVRLLLHYGANPDIKNHVGKTALIYAVENNNIFIVRTLLQMRANPNIQDSRGLTALFYAVDFNKFELVDLLLWYNASSLLMDIDGNQVVSYAKTYKMRDLIKGERVVKEGRSRRVRGRRRISNLGIMRQKVPFKSIRPVFRRTSNLSKGVGQVGLSSMTTGTSVPLFRRERRYFETRQSIGKSREIRSVTPARRITRTDNRRIGSLKSRGSSRFSETRQGMSKERRRERVVSDGAPTARKRVRRVRGRRS